MSGGEPDNHGLRRARWRIIAGIALVMTCVDLVVGAAIFLVMIVTQVSDVQRDLVYTASRSTVDSPPSSCWLVIDHGGSLIRAASLPANFPLAAPLAAVRGGRPAIMQEVLFNGTHYAVLTTRRGADVVQAGYDLHDEFTNRERLVLVLAIAEAAGLAGATVAGALLTRGAIAPLGDALSRQQRFVADASHELRTPITRLHTRAQLLVHRAGAANLPDRITADLNELVSGSRELGAVIEDVLRSAQLGPAGQGVTDVDLVEVARAVADAERVRTEQAGLTMTIHAAPDVPRVTGVASALRRVVSALVDNAIGHTPGGGTVDMVIAGDTAGHVLLTVRDNGVGFALGDADRLFDRHASGHAGVGPRFGLGLALVREVVTDHGGTITVHGEPGVGARFTVTLPASAARPAADPAPVRTVA